MFQGYNKLFRFDLIGLNSNGEGISQNTPGLGASLIKTVQTSLVDAKKVYLGRNPVINGEILVILLERVSNKVLLYKTKILDEQFPQIAVLDRQGAIVDFDAVVASNVISVFTSDTAKLAVDVFELKTYTQVKSVDFSGVEKVLPTWNSLNFIQCREYRVTYATNYNFECFLQYDEFDLALVSGLVTVDDSWKIGNQDITVTLQSRNF